MVWNKKLKPSRWTFKERSDATTPSTPHCSRPTRAVCGDGQFQLLPSLLGESISCRETRAREISLLPYFSWNLSWEIVLIFSAVRKIFATILIRSDPQYHVLGSVNQPGRVINRTRMDCLDKSPSPRYPFCIFDQHLWIHCITLKRTNFISKYFDNLAFNDF